MGPFKAIVLKEASWSSDNAVLTSQNSYDNLSTNSSGSAMVDQLPYFHWWTSYY